MSMAKSFKLNLGQNSIAQLGECLMPIVQAFCPDTGAAIGGGCGPAEPSGGGLYKTALEQVNLTDGSWTLFDPDNLVQSVSHAAGVNKVVWNALPVGSQNYRWDAGGQHRAPRWYKDNNIDGNRVNSMDFNIFTSVIENVDAVSDFNNQIVCGVSQIPTGLEIFQVDFTGVMLWALVVVWLYRKAMVVFLEHKIAATATSLLLTMLIHKTTS
jgi:hypothetical protein